MLAPTRPSKSLQRKFYSSTARLTNSLPLGLY
jgi:hypothetical protein